MKIYMQKLDRVVSVVYPFASGNFGLYNRVLCSAVYILQAYILTICVVLIELGNLVVGCVCICCAVVPDFFCRGTE